jgi:hypothetical protein
MKKNTLLLFAWLLLLLAACNQFDELQELDNISYEAEYALPLADTRISLRDILKNFEENATISISPEGLITFSYRGDVIAQTSDDIFESINKSLPPLIPIISPYMALPFSSPDGLEIDLLNLKGGSLVYYFENRKPHAVNVRVTFPQVTKNGLPLTYQHNMPAYSGSGNPPVATNLLLPTALAGYQIAAQNDSIYVRYEAIAPNGVQDTLSNFLIRLQDLSFSYAEGYFGNFLYKGSRDTIRVDFFDNWIRGDVYFEEPRITLNVENAFGIPTRSVVKILDVITVRGQILPLESPYVTSGIDFPYPAMNEVGQVKTGTFSFTKQNSNIDIILGAGPVAIDYDVDAITNPDSDNRIRGFISESSYYKVNLEVELPLYGKAAGFIVMDTLDINFGRYTDVDDVEFKLVTDNRVPLDVAVQVYFIDNQGNKIDSLLDAPRRLVKAAPVNAQGNTTGETRQITFADFKGDRFTRLREHAQQIILVSEFSTINDGNTSVRVLSSQDVRIRLGAKLGVRRKRE